MNPINISIKVDSNQADNLGDSFIRKAERLVDQILLDLEFPCKGRIKVEGVPTATFKAQVWVADKLCSVHTLRGSSSNVSGLEQSILYALSTDLSIYLTQTVADQFWNKLSKSGAKCPREVHKLLEQTIRYRLKPNRLPDIDDNWEAADLHTAFEEAFSSASRRIEFEFNPKRHQELADQLLDEQDSTVGQSGSMLNMMIDGLFYELGVVVGECVPTACEDLAYDQFRIRINDVHSPAVHLFGDDLVLVNDTVDRLTLLNIKGEEAINPANGSECAIIDAAYADIAEQAGLTTWNAAGYAVLHASAMLRQSAAALLTLEAMDVNLDKLAKAFPALTERVREGIGIPRLTRILRYLLDEELSIRNLRLILEGLLVTLPKADIDPSKYIVFTPNWAFRPKVAQAETDATLEEIEIAETVRMQQKSYISHKYTRGKNTLVVYLLDPVIEKRLSHPKALSSDEHTALLMAIHEEIGDLPPTAQKPVILTTTEVRYRLRKTIEREFPHTAVLSYNELSPNINIQPIARISADGFNEIAT